MKTEGTYHNLAGLAEMTDGDKEFESILIETFCVEAPILVENMISAHTQGDFQTMGRHAHSLKPNAQMFGISDLHEDILFVEMKGKADENASELVEKMNRIQQVILHVVNELK